VLGFAAVGHDLESIVRKLLVASTFLCAMSGYALAADAVVIESSPEVIVAPVFSWTGGYFGGQVGYLWGEGDFVSEDDTTAEIEPDGWLGGAYIGYNYQFDNNVVLGGDADFAWTGADDSASAFDAAGALIGTVDSELEWEGAVRVRLGYAVERFLPYVAGGVAFGRLSHDVFNGGGVLLGSDDDTSVGWTIGAGVEYAFTDNLIGRAEYRYTDFGDFDFAISDFTATTDLQTNDVRLGIAYKF
jgi:outer membrane immunogenic protein